MNQDVKYIQLIIYPEKEKKKKLTTPSIFESEKKQKKVEEKKIRVSYTNFEPIENNQILDSKRAQTEIRNKISNYKQQDKLKGLFNPDKFITFDRIIEEMKCKNLACHYCQEKMDVLYPIVRESRQWTVDRIDNDLGHNTDNFVLACLECNLKRRRRNDQKFKESQDIIGMTLVKLETCVGLDNESDVQETLSVRT